MILIKVNDKELEVDEKTAIGIDFQSYDIKTPSDTYINISNSFSVPNTAQNKLIFDNGADIQSTSIGIYSVNYLSYWLDNTLIVDNARVRVESIDERINLFIFEKDSIWDVLKTVTWSDFIVDYVLYLQTVKGYPTFASPFVGISASFFSFYLGGTQNELIVPFYKGNLANYYEGVSTTPVEDDNIIYLRYIDPTIGFGLQSDGGHISVYARSVFNYIEWKYDVNFLAAGGVVNGNIFDDIYANKFVVPARDISIRLTGSALSATIYFTSEAQAFIPLDSQKDKGDKTLYDFVTGFISNFNLIKDEFIINGENVIALRRFDNLEDLATVENWSGMIEGEPVFYPIIEGYNQDNYIKFSSFYTGGDSLINSKKITCENKNIDQKGTLFEIDGFVPSFFETSAGLAPNLSESESFDTFEWFIVENNTDDVVDVRYSDTGVDVVVFNGIIKKAELYGLDNEYNFIDDIITYPKTYTIKKWLSFDQIKNLEYFKQYYFEELNGSYFINKISGFNPEKSLQATELELIKISKRTPSPVYDFEFWVDGVFDLFIDGEGDGFY